MTAQAPGSNEASARGTEQAQSQPLPPGDCCLEQLHLEGNGERSDDPFHKYQCNEVQHERSTRTMRLDLKGNRPCNESGRFLGRLSATGEVVQRVADLSLYVGNFTLFGTGLSPNGVPGRIVTIDGIGTHTRLGVQVSDECKEPCEDPDHFEGWLEAEYVEVSEDESGQQQHTLKVLKAVIAGWLVPGQPRQIATIVISGTILSCKQP